MAPLTDITTTKGPDMEWSDEESIEPPVLMDRPAMVFVLGLILHAGPAILVLGVLDVP